MEESYKQQVTEEFLAAIKRRFPDIDLALLDIYEYAFLIGFNVDASCDNEHGRQLMFDYIVNLYNENVLN